MNAKFKKLYSLIASVVLLAITVGFALGALLPVFSVNTWRTDGYTGETFGECTLTKGLPVDEGKLSIKNILTAATNFSDMAFIMKVAVKEANIKSLERQAAKYPSSAASYAESILKLELDLLEMYEDYGEKNLEALEEKLQNDEAFKESLNMVVAMFAAIESQTRDDASKYYTDDNAVVVPVAMLLLVVLAVIGVVVVSIMAVIALIKSVRKFLAVLLKGDEEIEKIAPVGLISTYTLNVMVFAFVRGFFGTTIQACSGLVMCLIFGLLMMLGVSAHRVITQDKAKVASIVKVGLQALACLLSIVLLFAAANLPTWIDFKDNCDTLAADNFSDLKKQYYDEMVEQ